jgi:curved DNA-binding protein CbpA
MVKNDLYYQRLGVDSSATPDQIKKAYRKAIFRTHPDRNLDDPTAEKRAKEIIAAGSVLTDPTLRKKYDFFGLPDDSLDRAVNRAWTQNTGSYSDTSHQDYTNFVHQNWEANSAFGAGFKGYQQSVHDFGDIKPNGKWDKMTQWSIGIIATTALSAIAAYDTGLDSEPFSWFLSKGDQLAYTDWFNRSPDSARAAAAEVGGTAGFMISLGITSVVMHAEGIYKGAKSAFEYLKRNKNVRVE